MLFIPFKILPSTFDFHIVWKMKKDVCVCVCVHARARVCMCIGRPLDHLVHNFPFTPETYILRNRLDHIS